MRTSFVQLEAARSPKRLKKDISLAYPNVCSFSIFLGYKSSPPSIYIYGRYTLPTINRHLRKNIQIYEKHRYYTKVREFQDAATVQHMQITPSTFFGCSSRPNLLCVEWPPKLEKYLKIVALTWAQYDSSVSKLDHDGFIAQILECHQEFLLLYSL